MRPEEVVGVLAVNEGKALARKVEGDTDQLPPVVLLDHILADLGSQLVAELAIGRLLLGPPRSYGVAHLAPKETEEHSRRRRPGLGSGGR